MTMIGSTWDHDAAQTTDPGMPGSPRHGELKKLAREIWDTVAEYHTGMEDIAEDELERILDRIVPIVGKARIIR